MSATTETTEAVLPPPGLRFKLGLLFFVLCWTSPVFVPLVVLTDLPLTWKTALSGALVVGGPEVFGLIAIACLGKAGFAYLTQKLKAVFRRYGPPREVSRTRYNIGLVLMFGPFLLDPFRLYAPDWIPFYEDHRIVFNLILDAIFIISFFILGGAFWDKVRALFVYEATAQFPEKEAAKAG